MSLGLYVGASGDDGVERGKKGLEGVWWADVVAGVDEMGVGTGASVGGGESSRR